jgi:hypothetical protein
LPLAVIGAVVAAVAAVVVVVPGGDDTTEDEGAAPTSTVAAAAPVPAAPVVTTSAPSSTSSGVTSPLVASTRDILIPFQNFAAAMAPALDPGPGIWLATYQGMLIRLHEDGGIAVDLALDARIPRQVLAGTDKVWVAVPEAGFIRVVDTTRHDSYDTIALDPLDVDRTEGTTMALTSDSLWVATDGAVVQADRATGTETQRFEMADLAGVATAGEEVWAWQRTAPGSDRLVRLRPAGGAEVSVDVGSELSSIHSGPSGISLSRVDGSVVLLFPSSNGLLSSSGPSSSGGGDAEATAGNAAKHLHQSVEGPDGVWAWDKRGSSAVVTKHEPNLPGASAGVISLDALQIEAVLNTDHKLWVILAPGRLKLLTLA